MLFGDGTEVLLFTRVFMVFKKQNKTQEKKTSKLK